MAAEPDRSIAATPRVVLGSASPRRAALLQELGVEFTVNPSDIDETVLSGTDSPDVVTGRIARAKFEALRANVDAATPVLMTADTLVFCEEIMGKPVDEADAERMLRAMSDRWVRIVTTVCVGAALDADPVCRHVETRVMLRELANDEIRRYVATGEADDKAGALALQGGAGPFVQAVEGCWSNVLGLPICLVAELLEMAPIGRNAADRCSVGLCGGAFARRQNEAD